MKLTSPQGTESTLLPTRLADASAGGFYDWSLTSMHFWAENPAGKWKLEIEIWNRYETGK